MSASSELEPHPSGIRMGSCLSLALSRICDGLARNGQLVRSGYVPCAAAGGITAG
jgi:hypothetical protein